MHTAPAAGYTLGSMARWRRRRHGRLMLDIHPLPPARDRPTPIRGAAPPVPLTPRIAPWPSARAAAYLVGRRTQRHRRARTPNSEVVARARQRPWA